MMHWQIWGPVTGPSRNPFGKMPREFLWQWKNHKTTHTTLFLIGDTSWKGCFSIVMLVFVLFLIHQTYSTESMLTVLCNFISFSDLTDLWIACHAVPIYMGFFSPNQPFLPIDMEWNVVISEKTFHDVIFQISKDVCAERMFFFWYSIVQGSLNYPFWVYQSNNANLWLIWGISLMIMHCAPFF